MKDKVNQEVHKRLAHLLDSDLQTIFVLWDAAPTYAQMLRFGFELPIC